MPRIKKTIGNGMTERGIVRFDAEDPDDVPGLIEAGVQTFDRSSFERLSHQLSDLARRILGDCGLPSDAARLYLVAGDGTWSAPDPKSTVDDELDYLPLDAAVQACGHEPDSPQGYAADLLMILTRARLHLSEGRTDEAMALAFAAGELVNEAGVKEVFEKDVLTGERVSEGGRKGHEGRYGTQEEKAATRAEYVQAFDAARDSGLRTLAAYDEVARQFSVSETTIRRAVRESRQRS